jgi:hypothetical protein
MKPNQELTPKYWIFHSIESDDVFKDTAAKSLYDCKLLAAMLREKSLIIMPMYPNAD